MNTAMDSVPHDHSGLVLWITGFSGAGKTTVARHLRQRCLSRGIHPILLDGDAMRAVFGRTAAFSSQERKELAWTYARLCAELSAQGFPVICATISMFEDVRAWSRANIKRYCEVYLRVPLPERAARDPKGLYAESTAGGTAMVGDTTAEEPRNPDIVIDNCGTTTADQAVNLIWNKAFAEHHGLIS